MPEFTETLDLKKFIYPQITEKEIYDCILEAATLIESQYADQEKTSQLLSQQLYITTFYAIELALQKYQYKMADPLTDLLLPR